MSDYIKHKDAPIFEALYQEDYRITKSSSILTLSPSLTINGVTETPIYRYKGEDATDVAWNAWGYGPNLVTFGSGTLPTARVLTPICENGLQLNGGKSYKAAGGDTTSCAITTEDFVLEYVLSGANSIGYITAKNPETTSFWGVYVHTTYVRLWIANTTSVLTVSGILSYLPFHHIMIFADRSGSAQIYVNGVASGAPVNISGYTSTLDTAGVPFTLGCQGGGTTCPNATILYAAGWKRAAWLDTHLQATVASNRFKLLTGSTASISTGTSSSTFTRSFADGARVLKLENGVYNNFMLDSNWIRKEASGYLIEPAATQMMQVPRGVSWGFVTASSAFSTTEMSPFFGNYCAEVKATSTNNEIKATHSGLSAIISAGSKVVIVSYWKPGESSWVVPTLLHNSKYFGRFFNLSGAGSIGGLYQAPNAPTSSFISNVGNGWYKTMIYFASFEVTVSPYILVYLGEADGDMSYSASSTNAVQMYQGPMNIFVVDHAPANVDDHPSFIINKDLLTLGLTRPADVLYYKADDGNFNSAKGSLEIDFTVPMKPTSSANRCQYPNQINLWAVTGAPSCTTGVIGPEGLANACTITTAGATNAYYLVYNAGSAVANYPIAFGFHFKKSAGDTGYVGIGGTSSTGATGFWSINLSLLSNNWTWIDHTNISTYGSIPGGNEFYSASNGSAGLILYGDLSSTATNKTFSIANITAQVNGTFNVLKGDGLLSVSKSGLRGNSLEISMDYDGYVGFTEKNNVNLLANSTTYSTPAWIRRGAAAATDNTNETLDPLGGNTASKITGIAGGGQDMYQILTFIAAYSGTSLGLGLWIKRITTSGILNISSPANFAAGEWNINLATLPDAWVRLTPSSPYVTVTAAFSVYNTYVAGLMFRSNTTASFYLWNAEMELGVATPTYDVVNNSSCQFASISGATNYADGLTHTAKLSWYGANANLYVDGTLQGSTSNLVVPAGLDRIYCGAFGDGTVVSKKWIKNLKSYNY